MAAVAISHNITRLVDFNSAPPGTIGTIGGGPAATIGTDLRYEGTNCLRRRINATGSNFGFTYLHTATVDVTSAATKILYVKHNLTVSAAINALGAQFGVGESTSIFYAYLLADDGSVGDSLDFLYPPVGGFIIIPIEVALTAWQSFPPGGTADITIADFYMIANNVSETAAGENQSLDSLDWTTDGLFLVGGDGASADGVIDDFIDADEGSGLTGAERVGMFITLQPGVFKVFGLHVIGRTDAATVTNTAFTDAQKTLIFPGGNVGPGRTGLEVDLGNASTVFTITQYNIKGTGRSEHKQYFDTELQVNATTDRITIPGHGFATFDQLEYSDEGGTEDIGPDDLSGEADDITGTGIAAGPNHYVVRFDVDEFALHPTAPDSVNDTNIEALTASTAGNGERHSLLRKPDTRPDLTFVGTSGTGSVIDSSLDKLRTITLTSAVTITRGFISNSHGLILGDGTLDAVSIAGQTTSLGEAFLTSIHAQDLDLIDGSSFTSGDEGHAIEVTTGGTLANRTAVLTDVTITGYFAADDGSSGGWSFNALTDVDATPDDITITTHGFATGDAVYYSDEGGTAIGGLTDQALYFLRSDDANTVGVFLTKEAADTNANRIALTVGSSETHKFYSANAAIFNNSGADLIINISGGSTPTIRNSAGSTTTVNNTVSTGLSGVTEGTPVKIIANETVGTITKGDVIASGFADSTGAYTANSLNYEAAFDPSGLDVKVNARNQGVCVAAIAEDGGVFVDETDEAHSTATNDMTLLPAVPVASDAYYFGHTEEFNRLKIDISTVLTQSSAPTFAVEYWNGAWVAVSGLVDGTNGYETTGENIISFTAPGDFATTTVNAQGAFYYVRIRITAIGTITQVPIARTATIDATRYLPYSQSRIITSTGLADIAAWQEDTISKFSPTD